MKLLWLAIMVITITPWSTGQQDSFYNLEGFTISPTEHIITRVQQPFVVRSVRGVISAEEYREPPADVIFEIQGPGTERKFRGARTDKHGRFRIRDVPAGTYRFKATLNGWRSVMGIVTVSAKADKAAEIKLKMLLGV